MSQHQTKGFKDMTGLRRRNEREIEALITDSLVQVCKAPANPFSIDDPWRNHHRPRMRKLIKALELTKAVPNPAVGREAKALDPRRVISTFCQITGYTRAELRSDRRALAISRARHLLFYLLREFCQHMSYTRIGEIMNRDHTSVMHGVRRAGARLEVEPAYKELYHRVFNQLAYEA